MAFASPAQVTAGSSFALVLSSTSTGGTADFVSAATATNAYPAGQLYTAPRAAGPLTPQPGALVFVTYVTGGSSGGGGSAVGNVCTCGHAPSNPFPTSR